MDRFRYVSYPQEVIFGAGSLSQLSEAVEALGCRRLLLCTSHSIRSGGSLTRIETTLGDRLVAVFDRVLPHVQDDQVGEILALAAGKDVDAVIGMGGGSPIGMAKALASALDEQRRRPGPGVATVDRAPIPVVAIPCTYAGSEMTPVYGITRHDQTPARKVTISNPQITPRLVIYDPELTLGLPADISASTGINALAHCIEALYSKTRNPLSTAAATAAVRHISNALLRCYQEAGDPSLQTGAALQARTEMLLGAHLAGLALASVSMGLHHGLCHVLGGSANIPHGIANCIILPHAMRFNADVSAPLMLPAAAAMGLSTDETDPRQAVEELCQKISALIGRMNQPQRLRDAGVAIREADLPELARLAFQNHTVQNNPRPIRDAAQIERLLRDAW